MNKIFRVFLLILSLLGLGLSSTVGAQKSLLPGVELNSQPEFLEPNQAFKLMASINDGKKLRLRFDIAPKYYMYREQYIFSVIQNGAYTNKLEPTNIPKGVLKFDPTFNKELEVYHDKVDIDFDLPSGGEAFTLEVHSQGCAEAGLCYPPSFHFIPIAPTKDGYEITLPNPIVSSGDSGVLEDSEGSHVGTTWFQVPLSEESWADSVGASSGESSASDQLSDGTTNVAVSGTRSDTGSGKFSFKTLLQNNDLAIADFLQNSSVGLMILGAFLLGVLLSFTPCVLPMLPILLSVLVGNSSRSMATAGGMPLSETTNTSTKKPNSLRLTLFYVFGTSIVYTILGVIAASIGASLSNWIQNPWVIAVFALFLVAFALSMFGVFTFQMPSSIQSKLTVLQNKLPAGSGLGAMLMGMISALIAGPCVAAPLAGVLLFISQTGNIALGALILFVLAWGQGTSLIILGSSSHALLPRAGRWMNKVKIVCGVLLLAAAGWMVWPLVNGLGDSSKVSEHGLADVIKVESIEGFEKALNTSVTEGKPTMLYFSAEWCVSCRELKHFTFSDPKVQEALKGFRVIEADVTTNKAEHRDLLKKFKLFGPPGLIFFDNKGREIPKLRIVGFEGPDEFLKNLEKL